MSPEIQWIAAGLTVVVVGLYEVWFALALRVRPQQVARSVHASLREDWFDAISHQPGSEILTVQTLRNSLMSASMTASTAVLGLMGTMTLSASSLNTGFSGDGAGEFAFTPRMAMELVLLALLFASLVSSVMAVRYYNHVGFVGALPVGSEERRHWHAIGRSHLRRAGILYSGSLRHLVLVVPAVAFILHPIAGPVAATLAILVLLGVDRVQTAV